MKEFRKIIVIAAIAFLFLLCCYGVRRIIIMRRSDYKKEMLSILPGIVCWGDSLTFGADGEFMAYPEKLRDLIEERIFPIPVHNMGVGGEDSITILGRQGAVPFRVYSFNVPEDTVKTEIRLMPNMNKAVKPIAYENANGINYCFIEGIKGEMTAEKREDGLHYYFARLEPGARINIPEGTPIITAASLQYHDCITIVFMGANGGYDDVEDLIYQQKCILDTMDEGNDKYLIITTTGGDAAENEAIEMQMQVEYGEKYLNLREYLVRDGLHQAGIEASDMDKADIVAGRVPTSLRKDGIHYNDAGTTVASEYIYRRLDELGYFDGIKSYIASRKLF